MKTYTVTYALPGKIRIEAETADEAQRKFETMNVIDLACMADDLQADAPVEEGKEPEGLSKLKVGDMMSRATW